MFRAGTDRAGVSQGSSIASANVTNLAQAWTATTSGAVRSSPAVTGDIAYVGSDDGKLYAVSAVGSANCSGLPESCRALWTGLTGGAVRSSPAVANGIVYVGSDDHKLYAFDATGGSGCTGIPKVCSPRWSATTGDVVQSSPVVAEGVVYVGSADHKLYAFDAAGKVNCSTSAPATCSPLWTAVTGGAVYSSPSVAGGMVYVGSDDGRLYAFDAAGSSNCSASPKVCTPLWTGTVGAAIKGAPAVANNTLYVGAQDGVLYAFDAAGSTNCSGAPEACAPLWRTTAAGGAISSSPAVTKTMVYVGSADHRLYAFDAGGNTDCSSSNVCSPVWTALTGGAVSSSPAVANGVVYVGSGDHKLYGFDASGVNCAGNPKTCTAVWTATTGDQVLSSPAVGTEALYVGSNDHKLYGYRTCDKIASTSGSDGNPGTRAAPWHTAQYMVDHLAPGQTGCLRSGIFDFDDEINITQHNITLTSYPGERATLKGALRIQKTGHNVTVRELDLDGRNPETIIGPAIFAANDTFDNVDVTNFHSEICFILGPADPSFGRAVNAIIENSRIHDCGKFPSQNGDHGFYVEASDRAIIRNNWIYDNVDRGIQLYPDSEGTQVYGNVIDGNGEGVIFGGDGTTASSNNSVHNNIITNSNIRWNVEANWPPPPNSTTPLIGTGNTVHDNCVWATNTDPYYNQDGGVMTETPRGFAVANNIIANPMYVDRANADFRLQPGSPCAAVFDGTT